MAAPIVTRIGPQVGGLQPALQLLIKTTSASPDPQQPEEEQRRLVRAALLPIIIQEIRVRDAGPFLQMMRLPVAGPGFDVEWVLPNRQAIEKVTDAANVVLLLVDPMLPCLLRLPTDATHLRVVDASAVNLSDFARAARVSFKTACTEFLTQPSPII